jgi:hypothetical protein
VVEEISFEDASTAISTCNLARPPSTRKSCSEAGDAKGVRFLQTPRAFILLIRQEQHTKCNSKPRILPVGESDLSPGREGLPAYQTPRAFTLLVQQHHTKCNSKPIILPVGGESDLSPCGGCLSVANNKNYTGREAKKTHAERRVRLISAVERCKVQRHQEVLVGTYRRPSISTCNIQHAWS